MTSHWPTFSDGLFWCACDNRTFTSQDDWQLHVLRAMVEEHRRIRDALAAIPDEPPSLFRNLWTGEEQDEQP
jgi:hypothetical protein